MKFDYKFSFNENLNPIEMIQLLQNLVNLNDSKRSVNSI